MKKQEIVRVSITGATNTFSWYWDKTGQVFEAVKMSTGYIRVDNNGNKTRHFIEGCDCVEVE